MVIDFVLLPIAPVAVAMLRYLVCARLFPSTLYSPDIEIENRYTIPLCYLEADYDRGHPVSQNSTTRRIALYRYRRSRLKPALLYWAWVAISLHWGQIPAKPI